MIIAKIDTIPPMKNERESEAYLPPQEQLIVAAKVNRLCEADSETFDPKTQVQDAQDIVNALNSRMKPHGRFSGRISFPSRPTSEVRAGATNAGNLNVSVDEPKAKEFKFGIEEYRIGNYVAMKHTGEPNMEIVFEHFRDRAMANKTLRKSPKDTRIAYDKKSLEVQEINIGVPTIREIAYFLTIVTYRNILLWKKSQ